MHESFISQGLNLSIRIHAHNAARGLRRFPDAGAGKGEGVLPVFQEILFLFRGHTK